MLVMGLLSMLTFMFALMLIMALFLMSAMVIPMKGDTISITEVIVGNTDVTPITRGRQTKPMRSRLSVGVSQGTRLSVFVAMLFLMIFFVLVTVIIITLTP